MLSGNQGGKSMISTGTDGMPLQGYWPKRARKIFVNTLHPASPPASAMKDLALVKRSSLSGIPAELQPQVRLDRRTQVSFPAMVYCPRSVRSLPFEQVSGNLRVPFPGPPNRRNGGA